jgi:LPXTG-motif cell wall-anchored protein
VAEIVDLPLQRLARVERRGLRRLHREQRLSDCRDDPGSAGTADELIDWSTPPPVPGDDGAPTGAGQTGEPAGASDGSAGDAKDRSGVRSESAEKPSFEALLPPPPTGNDWFLALGVVAVAGLAGGWYAVRRRRRAAAWEEYRS